MDKARVWMIIRQYSKTAAGRTAETGRWSAEKWRSEAERRRELRKLTQPLVRDARRAVAVARKDDPERKTAAVHRAERELRTAKRRVPNSLLWLATKTVAGVGVAGYVGLPYVPDRVWLWSAVAVAAAVVAGLAWLAVSVARFEAPEPGLEPTQEESEILARLQPEHWTEHAPGRGLDGTVTGRPELTASGIAVQVRLDGKWTPGKLDDAMGNIRALLGCRTALRMEIRAGERGGWAVLTLRTRLAADGARMDWAPTAVGIGLDTVTGEPVEIPLDNRLTVAGASGSGKSWSSRPHMAAAHRAGHLVFVDGKGEEATVWEKVCRVAVEPEEIRTAVAEVHAEMNRRKADMKRRGISVWDGPQLTLFVDEGRVILALKDKKLTQQLIDISALGRSRGVVLWWATQYPVTSGDAPGIHAQIAANTDSRFALRVKNLTHAQVALDDDADYGPHLIEASKKMRGHGYLGGHGPRLIRTWTMTDAMVKSLPAKHWTEAPAEVPADSPAATERPGLRLVKDGDFLLAPPAVSVPAPRPVAPAEGTDAKVLEALSLLRPPVRQKDIVVTSGLPKGTVSKAVKRLVDAGQLVRHDDGTVSVPGATEATA
ncbi:MarR family transcriptional regulator [Streptomyces scopuliridis]|nr:helix-turn-helix domain-containing protein [Streptomyces scopuliridis]